MTRRWVARMRWRDLLFAHWTVDVDALRAVVPAPLEIETFEDRAYLAIVPFLMDDVAPRGLPAAPYLSVFPEVNLRTYVRYGDRTAVYFLSLEAARRLFVEGARGGFHLPYFHARMSIQRDGDWFHYRSSRIDRRGRPAELDVRYRPTGPAAVAAPGTLDAWLTDRLALVSFDGQGRLSTTAIAHEPWQLRPAEAQFAAETISGAAGVPLTGMPAHLAFADRVDVRAWWPERLPARTVDPR